MKTIFLEIRKRCNFMLAASLLILAACGGLQTPVEVVESTVSHPQWSVNANMYEVNVRQYTPEGTFAAFAEHLPRLQAMGVDILWFMPVTPIGEENRKGTLGSYYSVKDYTDINPEFGTLEDFRDLVNRIHGLGMYVIIDWVANHTAWDHEWTGTNPEFYYRDENGNFTPPHDTDWSDVIQLDFENRRLWDAMISEMAFWVREMDIDGFRCDVAYMVPTEFWNQGRAHLETIKPVFMLAEADHPELQEHAFNAGYSWISHHAMNRIARGDDDVSALDNYFFEENRGNYPEGTYKINFITNHDENSWAGTEFERLGEAKEAFAVMIATAEGMPLLYSGQEAGFNRRLEFFEKDQIEWDELRYEDFYRDLLNLKSENRALWNGAAGGPMARINTNHDRSVFSYVRERDGNRVLVVLNLSPEARNISFRQGDQIGGRYTELFSRDEVRIDNNFNLQLAPWDYRVYYIIMKLILILLILFSRTLSNAQNIDKVLHRVNVITMTDDKILYDYSVLIAEDLIIDIIPSKNLNLESFQIARVIELKDKYVMPALADMHMHSSGFNEEAFNVYLSYGITTLRFMVGDDNFLKSNPGNILKPDYPDIIMAGNLIDGYPPSWGEQHTGPIITKLEDVRPEVDRQIEKGYDLIKLYPRLKKDVYEEFLNYAYERECKLSGHIPVTVDTAYFFNHKMQEIQHLSGYGRYCTTLDSISGNVFYYDLNYDKEFARQYCLEKIERAAKKTVHNNVWNCPTLGFNYFQHNEKYRKALDQQRLGGKLEGLLGWWSTSEAECLMNYTILIFKGSNGSIV
jgi:glycosidase